MMLFVLMMCQACTSQKTMISNKQKTAKDILGNPDYLAISYGGYRHENRDKQPTIDQLKEDQKTALLLRCMQDFSFSEIGDILGISPEAAKMKIQRAKQTVIRKYEELQERGKVK